MTDKKIIAVVGATGTQGGGLVRAILGDSSGGFAVRALTRDVDSEKAQELAKLGAEVVQADLDSGPSLRAAFDGAYGAFCVTFFFEHFVPEKELVQAAAMAQAAKQAGVPGTCMLPSFYWENLISMGMGPKKGAGGKLELTLPMGDKRLAGIAAEDIGKCGYCIFKASFDLLGQTAG